MRVAEHAGLTWVGPPAKAIAAMGDKMAAKALLADAGVPMLPTWTDSDQVTDFPVLVKASAGGGGRGMRVVRDSAGLAEAVAAARREAAAAFGDGTVFFERYVEQGRHVEVQIFGDTHGTVLALGERECSIQRRHQKIVEEAPRGPRRRSCGSGCTRRRWRPAAPSATSAPARSSSCSRPTGEFYFLEMNTRLQVEHPVTEAVTGLDLVRLQLLVAEGEPLPLDRDTADRRPRDRGTALRRGAGPGLPPGHRHPAPVRVPRSDRRVQRRRPSLRLDSAVVDGSTVSVHYDSMLAKLIAWAPDPG